MAAAAGSVGIVGRVAGRIEWVHEPTRFAALADEWERAASQNPLPFGDHAWFQAWWEAFGAGRLAVCVLWEDRRLEAALPLASHRGRLAGLSNYHTPLFTAPARDDESRARVVEEAMMRPGSELTLDPVRTSDPLYASLLDTSERSRRLLLIEQLYRSPRVELEGDFETYGRSRGRGFKDITRRWRKLNRECQASFRFEESIEDLDAELERGYKVEASGWKQRRSTAILSSAQTRAFYTAIAHAYHARGELRLIWLDIDGEPAAFSFCLLRAKRLYSLKIGIDERRRPYAPGLMMDYCTIQLAFELGLESYELLGADEPYKRRFATSYVDHVRLRSYRRRPAAVTRYLTRRLARPLVRRARERLSR